MSLAKKKFDEVFYPYREQPIAIYGLGELTKEILSHTEGKFHIAGLLDGYRTEGEIYGKPILSLEEIAGKKTALIIIAARPSSCRIIVNRIGVFCRENGIRIFDADGNEFSGRRTKGEKISLAVGSSRKELLDKIDAYEVISFDVFDTLLMRKTLYPEDVFGIVERKMPSALRGKLKFERERQTAERELSRDKVPTWEEIYEYLGKRNGLSEQETEKLKRLEWETEKQLAAPRKEMCQAFQYALRRKKEVYLVSDMYFSESQLEELLREHGITGYKKLLVSCEYGTAKNRELFQYLYKEAGNKPILHIGDSQAADVEGAARYGIEGIQIFSALDMFEQSGMAVKLDRQDTLEERIKLGMFIARLFNSPFMKESGNGGIKEPEDLGYLLFAPVLTDFTLWLWHKVKENEEKTVLFGARDGFLVKQLFDMLQKKDRENGGKKPESIYFLTSRMCAALAGIFTEKDIGHVAGMGFSGSFEQMLKARFGLMDEEVKDGGSIEEYAQLILSRAEEKRANYLKYIEGLELKEGKKVFFDFVSAGTCQLALEKVLGEKMQGYYFMRVDADYDEKKGLDIQGFYPPGGEKNKGGIYEDYFILENILSSPMPSLKAFDEEGEPEYLRESRTEDEILFVERVHVGIKEYFGDYLGMWDVGEPGEGWPQDGGKELSQMILELIHCILADNDRFLGMRWTDGFYGRSVGMDEMV